jgi:ABC-2 type transport system permease protein
MNRSIVKQLVFKDLQIMKHYAIAYWVGGILAIVIAVFGNDTAGVVGFILFVAALFGAGIHAAMATVFEERRQQTLAFMMSLPITIREYTSTKLISNMLLVGTIWLTLSAASYVIFIGDSMPLGMAPFMTIILVAILMAYVMVLATTLIFESEAPTVIAVVAANLVTQGVLWWLSGFHAIRSTIGGQVAVWNSTVITVLILEIALIIGLLWLTYFLQSRKTVFVG